MTDLEDFVGEAQQLRQLPELPGGYATPGQLMEYLLDVRRRQDRIEELLRIAIRAKAIAERRHTAAQADADEAWDKAAMERRNIPVQMEYVSAKERAAAVNLDTLAQRRQARQLANLVHECAEVVDILRLTHRGIDSVRQDVLTILRALQFESHLER